LIKTIFLLLTIYHYIYATLKMKVNPIKSIGNFLIMKVIILIRHAKSSCDLPLRDFDRPLTENGIVKAIKMAKKSKEYIPEQYTIWSSSAKRASDTAKLIVQNWDLDANAITFSDALYTFDERKLSAIVKSCSNDCNNLILFGHNNAITDFVNKFGDIFIDNVPTAGFVSIIFETNDWNAITKGKTVKKLFPRDC
jgi:phosphohistidine phosphatase